MMRKLLKGLKSLLKAMAGGVSLVLQVAYLAGSFHTKILPGVIAQPKPGGETEPPSMEVILKEEPVVERVPGTIAAKHEISVSSRLLATIQNVMVRAGDTVQAGDPLILLDSRDLEARELQAKQQLAAARAQLDEALKEYERMSALFKENVVPTAKADQVERAYRVALAQVDSASQAVVEAEVAQTYARIKAPVTGRVIDRLAEPGDTAVPGVPLLKLYNPSELRLEAYVRESLSNYLTRGDRLQVFIDALDKSFEGKVEEMVPQSEPGARAFLVKVGLPLDERLYPGMFGRVLIQTGTSENLYIPHSSVRTVGQLETVKVFRDGNTPGKRMIKTGRSTNEGLVQVLSGLEAGEKVYLSVEGRPK